MKQITKEGIVSLGDFPEFSTPSIFGSGSNPDGSPAMDGTNTFTFANKSGSGSGATYTLLRSIYVNALTVGTASNTITLKTNGFKIYCSGTVTLTKGAISCDGNTGAAAAFVSAGSGATAFGTLGSATSPLADPAVSTTGGNGGNGAGFNSVGANGSPGQSIAPGFGGAAGGRGGQGGVAGANNGGIPGAGAGVIGGFTPPQGARKYFGALLVGYYEKKRPGF